MDEAPKCQETTESLGSWGSSGQLPPVPWDGKSWELRSPPRVQRKPFAELLWRQSRALHSSSAAGASEHSEKAMVTMDRSASPWSMHIENALHSQRFPQFYFLEDFPGFLLNIGGLNIYISIYEYIFSTYTT